MAKKKIVNVKVDSVLVHEINESFEEFTIGLVAMRTRYSEFDNLHIQSEECDNLECYGIHSLIVTGDRLETDKEFEKRVRKEKKERDKRKVEKQKREEWERKEYEKLKKKYGD